MKAATAPAAHPDDGRLLVVDPVQRTLADDRVLALPRWLRPNDLLVVNDAATLPASLPARTEEGHPVEVRLAGEHPDGTWTAVLFGPGDWQTDTDHRPPPARLPVGSHVYLATGFNARVTAVSPRAHRVVTLAFNRQGAAFWEGVYRVGRPVQYSYLRRAMHLEDVQTVFASRPWAVETPSAGRPLTHGLLAALRDAGVNVATVTHAAGLSATGDPALDRTLPWPERTEVTAATRQALRDTKARGARVIAVGTSVVRALTHAAAVPGDDTVTGVATAVVRPGDHPVVDGLLTGMHEPGTSHHDLVSAFIPGRWLAAVNAHAAAQGYQSHEFGDSCLVLSA